jgi:hypothetical protein
VRRSSLMTAQGGALTRYRRAAANEHTLPTLAAGYECSSRDMDDAFAVLAALAEGGDPDRDRYDRAVVRWLARAGRELRPPPDPIELQLLLAALGALPRRPTDSPVGATGFAVADALPRSSRRGAHARRTGPYALGWNVADSDSVSRVFRGIACIGASSVPFLFEERGRGRTHFRLGLSRELVAMSDRPRAQSGRRRISCRGVVGGRFHGREVRDGRTTPGSGEQPRRSAGGWRSSPERGNRLGWSPRRPACRCAW